MKRTLLATAALTLWAGTAMADAFTDGVVAKFQEMGFAFIEVQDGLTQVKVEGIKGSTQLEVIYDRATGRILKQEQGRAEAENVGRSGVQIRERNRDFLRVPVSLSAGSAVDTEALISDLRSQGYDFIEVKRGPTQTKVEATRGGEQLEIVFDNATGEVLKREVGRADARDIGRSGIEIDTEDRDFVGDRRGRGGDHDDHDNNDNSGHGSSNSGSGSSNSGSGSSNSGSGSSNSGSGSSNSGSGSGSSNSGSGSSGSGKDDS
jgi:hypothetical protein